MAPHFIRMKRNASDLLPLRPPATAPCPSETPTPGPLTLCSLFLRVARLARPGAHRAPPCRRVRACLRAPSFRVLIRRRGRTTRRGTLTRARVSPERQGPVAHRRGRPRRRRRSGCRCGVVWRRRRTRSREWRTKGAGIGEGGRRAANEIRKRRCFVSPEKSWARNGNSSDSSERKCFGEKGLSSTNQQLPKQRKALIRT
jgi:hypothetical protein